MKTGIFCDYCGAELKCWLASCAHTFCDENCRDHFELTGRKAELTEVPTEWQPEFMLGNE